jgi:hypothetical protein
MAAEELGRTGKLVTSQEKLNYALEQFYNLLPEGVMVPKEMALVAIHSFIHLANAAKPGVIEIKEAEEVTIESQTLPPVQG